MWEKVSISQRSEIFERHKSLVMSVSRGNKSRHSKFVDNTHTKKMM